MAPAPKDGGRGVGRRRLLSVSRAILAKPRGWTVSDGAEYFALALRADRREQHMAVARGRSRRATVVPWANPTAVPSKTRGPPLPTQNRTKAALEAWPDSYFPRCCHHQQLHELFLGRQPGATSDSGPFHVDRKPTAGQGRSGVSFRCCRRRRVARLPSCEMPRIPCRRGDNGKLLDGRLGEWNFRICIRRHGATHRSFLGRRPFASQCRSVPLR